MIILLKTGVSGSTISATPPVYSEELWNRAGFITLDAYMTAADHTPTEPCSAIGYSFFDMNRAFLSCLTCHSPHSGNCFNTAPSIRCTMLSQSGHCLRKMRKDIPPEHSSKSALDGQPKLPIEIACNRHHGDGEIRHYCRQLSDSHSQTQANFRRQR